MSTQPKRTQEELFFPLKAMPQGNHRKRPVLLLSSVKGGSGKTYSALSMALGITRILNQKIKSEENNTSKVCVIDLDLSATNMCALLETANDDLASEYIQFEQKKSIHEYILHAVNRSIDLSQYISKLTYGKQISYLHESVASENNLLHLPPWQNNWSPLLPHSAFLPARRRPACQRSA